MKLRWQLGIIAAVILSFFTFYPQMKLLYLRGEAWNGHYAYNDIDEVAYASYVRALIDGRPRKNDPYSGRDDTPESPQPESLFSIQFAAPYTIAIPARILGIGTPWAMTLSGIVAGFLAALAAFWLVGRMTGSSLYAMASSIIIFAGGALAAGEGALPEILYDGFSYPYFPGFRRYIPAMAMPAFFAFCGLVWGLLNASDRRKQLIYGGLAVLCFAYTVFSYFYIWTTAAAFLGCVLLIWLVFRPNNRWEDIKKIAALGAGCLVPLVLYAYLLSQRSESLEHVQLLVFTRMPDLARVPIYISIACLFLIIFGLARKLIRLEDRSTLFALSIALVPVVVFNQQIITGRSLQPIHYQVFIGNYVAALALMVTIGVLWVKGLREAKPVTTAACLVIAIAATVWGIVECHYTVRVLDDANIERDIALPVAKRLEQLALSNSDPHRSTVLAYDMIQADDLPSVAPQNVLWARHQHVFAGLSWDESKERYYQYLYYSGVDENGLDHLLKNDFVTMIALFGWGRHTDRLSTDAKPLTYGEIEEEVRRYSVYRESFGPAQAANPLLSYVVINNESRTNTENLELWYERYDAETIGKYTIYKVRLRP